MIGADRLREAIDQVVAVHGEHYDGTMSAIERHGVDPGDLQDVLGERFVVYMQDRDWEPIDLFAAAWLEGLLVGKRLESQG